MFNKITRSFQGFLYNLTISSLKEKDVNRVFTRRYSFPAVTGALLIMSIFWTSLCHAETPTYHLDVNFLPEEHLLQGTATITIPSGKEWHLYAGGLAIQEIIMTPENGNAITMPLPLQDSFGLYGSNSRITLKIQYSFTVPNNAPDNLISPSGIALTSNWHPIPKEAMLFSLTASLPKGFRGISESDTQPVQEAERLSTSFSQAVRSINLVAGPYLVEQESIRKGLLLSTWFFEEDQELSRGYLEATKSYIQRYEEALGPFPYNHFAIVANRLPSGFGMPTFTLLGQQVLRLPFIKNTSLGHEILHSWFGNSITVAEDSGNWCEGLTSYLADFSYATDKDNGAAHRKTSLVTYQSFVKPDSAITLHEFRSASHNQPMAKAIRAIGYTRAAMLFHQLRAILGNEDFSRGLQLFTETFKGSPASWKDIQTAFETASDSDLTRFFTEQLSRKDVPILQTANIETTDQQDQSTLTFNVIQRNKQPYSLKLPIRVQTMSGSQDFIREINKKETTISLTLTEPPLSLTIDPEYDLFRAIADPEFPPVWSRFMGAEKKLVIIPKNDTNDPYAPFLLWAKQQDWPILKEDTISNKQLSENSIIFLGTRSLAFRSLFGSVAEVKEGFSLTVQNNPLNEKDVIVAISSSSTEETAAVTYKLRHYGSYSSLVFEKGRVQKKETAPSNHGLKVSLEHLPTGVATSAIKTFDQIITELSHKRVIYIGETHNSLADHRLQLRIIQALHGKGVDLAVGMEMFPASSQDALDNYLLKKSDMNEADFLRASRWFDVWRYDWRLFRPTFNFLRKNKIPVYGINVDRKIVSQVFTDGNTDGLDAEQTKIIASERDLFMDGYVQRLRQVYGAHSDVSKGKAKGIAGFVQSQAIWDESMAENITGILKKHPQKTVVVIAGTQHTRKDSGIPPRLLRRTNIPQASIINIYADTPPDNPKFQADYIFMSSPVYLEPKGKIGISLKPEKDDKDRGQLRITGLSHAGKAKEAGLQKDDIIISANGQPVKNMEDIGIIMMDAMAGDKLNMTLLRKNKDGEPQEIEVEVTLSDMAKPPKHP